MKKNYFRLLKPLLMLMVAFSAVLSSRASNHEKVQQIFDGIISATRSESDISVIDISEYPVLLEPVTETILVEKRSLRLVNGTMTQAAGFNGPIIKIVNGNTLELAESATLAGNNKKSDNPLVDVANGTFEVYGNITNIYGGVNPGPNTDMNTAVELSGGSSANFTLSGGQVQGCIENSKSGFVKINSGSVGRVSTANEFVLGGSALIQANVYFYSLKAIIGRGTSKLQNKVYISNYSKDQAVMKSHFSGSPSSAVSSDDVDKLVLVNNINGYYLSLENNVVYVREASPSLADGDTFTEKTAEGVDMFFRVISASEKTAEVYAHNGFMSPSIDKSTVGAISIPSVAKGYKIVKINSVAFYNCDRITSVYIPETVSTIANSVFWGCTSLTGTNIPNSVTRIEHDTFHGCSELRSISIPAGVNFIGKAAFWGCSNLQQIKLPEGISILSEDVFCRCSSLENVNIPESVTTIDKMAFYDCSSLSNIDIPKNVSTIGGSAFNGCRKLKSMFIHKGIINITGNPFGYCPSLSNIFVEDGNPVFDSRSGCNALIKTSTNELISGCKNTTIPHSVQNIADFAFEGCAELLHLSIPEGVQTIGTQAFDDCKKLKEINLPQSLTAFGGRAFASCESLESITLPKGITEISFQSFCSCYKLKSINIPSNVVSIEEGAFINCNLHSVTIPKSVKSIEANAFNDCVNLKEIKSFIENPFSIAESTFISWNESTSSKDYVIYNNAVLHVPQGCLSKYKDCASWSLFKNIVDDLSEELDPNNITNEDDLQKILDDIAAKKPATPVNIRICEEGITLTKNILARQNCKAIISGGPISVKQGFGGNVLFYVDFDAYLGFSNISFDFLNFKYRPSCFYVSMRSVLEISESVEYKNISTNTVLGWGREQGFYRNEGKMILRGGDISGIEGNGISNCGVIEMRGDIFKYGIRIYNYFNVNPNGIYLGTIRLLSSIPETCFWSFNGNWDAYPLETPFIVSSDSYTMQASDSWQIKYTGLPSKELKRTACYDDSRHSVQLKTYRSAQDIFDGDEEETLDCDGADVGEDLSISQKQQLIFDGDCPEETPTIWMPGGCMFFEPLLPWATISDITFNSFSNGHRIYVRTRVEYQKNVRARNFLIFTIVEKGGYLIWRNAWTENVLYPIYNDGGTVDIIGGSLTGMSYNLNGGIFGIWGDTKVNIIDNNATLTLGGNVSLKEIKQGPLGKVILTSKLYNKWTIDLAGHSAYDYYDGQFILEGGNGYVLTAADLALIDFRLPAGCSISLDTVRNAIVLHVAAFLPGDVNLDWAVDVADIAAVISVMAESDGSLTKTTDVNGDGTVDVADIATIIDIMAGKTVPTPTGHKTVNLGLPSGTLWAETNIGAVSPEDYGSYFAWGETGEKTTFGWNNYIWCNGTQASMTKYCTSTDFGTVDGKRQLDLSDDVAHATWGGSWRMPTGGDIEELLNNTTSEWTTQNGVVGRKFYSKTNGNSIFLPAAGYRMGVNTGNAGNMGSYWTSSLQEDAQYGAKILYFTSNAAASDYAFYRYVGQPVRPVYKKAVVVDGIVELTSGIANWDAAYLTGKGYFCYKKDATTSTSAGSNYHSLTYIPLNSSDMVCIIAKKSDNLPTQLVTKTGVVYFSYLNNSVLELVYDDGKSVNVLGSMPCSKEYLQTLSSLHKGDAFKSLLAIASALLKGNTGSTTIGTTYKNYAELFGTVSNESYVQNDAAVASIATSATGNFLFAEEADEWYDETVEFIFNTLQLWTGEATFKVGGSSCTLSGAVFCPSDVYNDYGTYGIICDANKANLTLGNAEYEQTGYQSPADMGFSVDFRGFKPNTTYYYRAYYKFNSSNHGNISPKHGNMTDPVIYDTTIKSFKTGDNILTVDVAMCIDVTGSMSDIINTVKSNAISFYDQFKQSCEEEGIQLAALNTQVFAYRDKNVDTNWLQTSSTFSLPSQRTAFNNFVNGLKADGGGDGPESGLETLQAAFNKSDWGVDDGYHRHVVILWTDAPYLVGSSYSNVELSTLASQWNAMPSGRRLILFAPYGTSSSNGGSWGNLDGWTNLIHETDLTNGFNNFDYILKSIIGELTSKAKARMSRPIQEETYFRPNE